MTFTKDSLRSLRTELENALEPLEKKHNIKLSFGNIRFDETTFSTKLTGAVSDNKGNFHTEERKSFVRYASLYGLKPADLDKKFTHDKKEYRIVGLRRRSKKTPIVVQQIKNNKLYLIPPGLISNPK